MPHGLCLWAAGNAPHPLAQDIIGRLQPPAAGARPRSRIETDAWLRVVGVPDGSAFAAGDCAEHETGPLPQTAMVASQQGDYLARLLNTAVPGPGPAPPAPTQRLSPGRAHGPSVARVLEAAASGGDEVAKAVLARGGEVAAPFQLVYLGILAYLGGQQALAQIRVSLQDVDGPGGEGGGVDQGGLVGWIMWRGVYVVKQIALRNRVRPRGPGGAVGDGKGRVELFVWAVLERGLTVQGAGAIWVTVRAIRTGGLPRARLHSCSQQNGQVLILADWIKSRVFGRDIAIYSQGDEGASPVAVTVLRLCKSRAHRCFPVFPQEALVVGLGILVQWGTGASMALRATATVRCVLRLPASPGVMDLTPRGTVTLTGDPPVLVVRRRGGSQDAAVAGPVEHLSSSPPSPGHSNVTAHGGWPRLGLGRGMACLADHGLAMSHDVGVCRSSPIPRYGQAAVALHWALGVLASPVCCRRGAG